MSVTTRMPPRPPEIKERPKSPPKPKTESATHEFRPDIEGLRAVAIVAVVLDHAGLGSVTGGYIGVDVFFVISGYLITQLLFRELTSTRRISLARFYARRVRRILPAASVVIIATMLAVHKWTPPLEVHSQGMDALAASFFYINYHLAANGTNYFANPNPSPFQQYWSLAIEEQFYALWPILLIALAWFARPFLSIRRAVSLFLLVAIGVSLWYSATLTASSPTQAYFSLGTRVWELALGGLIAVNAEGIARVFRAVGGLVTTIGLGAIVFAAFEFTSTTPYPGLDVALPVVGAGLIIAAGGAHPKWGAKLLLERQPVRYIGRVSYSWYLWHWPVLIFLPLALKHTPTTTDLVLAVIGSFVLASLSYYIVEQPFHRSRALVRHPSLGLPVGAGLIGAAVAVTLVIVSLAVIPGTGPSTPPVSAAPPTSCAGDATGSTAAIACNVQLATQIQALPSNLSPPLAKVPNEYSLGCINSPTATRPTSEFTCTLGDTSATRTVVLFGDSHAWQWTAPLAAIAKARHWKLVTYTMGGCPAEDFVYFDPSTNTEDTQCESFRNAVFSKLAAMKPAVVIMSSYTQFAASPASMTLTINKLKKDGSRVVWLEDTPYPGFNIPDCLSQNPTDVQKCSFSVRTGLKYPGVRKSLNSAAAKDGALIVNPQPWLCTNRVCPAVIGNTATYFDESHVTKSYALDLTPMLARALAPALPS